MADESSRYRSRRFLFALFIEVMATVTTVYFAIKWDARGDDIMDLLRWWRDVAGMVLALYGISSFAEKKVSLGAGGGA